MTVNGNNSAGAAPSKADVTKRTPDSKSKKSQKAPRSQKTELAAEKAPAPAPAALVTRALSMRDSIKEKIAAPAEDGEAKAEAQVVAAAVQAVVVEAQAEHEDTLSTPAPAVPKDNEPPAEVLMAAPVSGKIDTAGKEEEFAASPVTAAQVQVTTTEAATTEKIPDAADAAVHVAKAADVQVVAAPSPVLPAAETPHGEVLETEPSASSKAVHGAISKSGTDIRAMVKDGLLYVCGRVNGIFVYASVQADETAAVGRAKAEAVVDFLRVEAEKMSLKTTDVVLVVKAKLEAGAFEAEKRVVSLREFAAGKANDGLVAVTDIAKRVPVPAGVQSTAVVVRTRTGDGIVYFKGGCMRIASRVGDSVVVIKASGVHTYAVAQARAKQILTTVLEAAERRRTRANGGLTMAKGKVGDLVVRVRANVDERKNSLKDALSRCRAAIDDLAVTKALKHSMVAVGDKVNDVTLITKDGYVYAVTRVGDATVCVKARVVDTASATQLKIVETYASTEAAMQSVADRVVKRALESYSVTKATTLVVAEKARSRADTLAEQSKRVAEQRPITTSTASGCALGGAGGGAAGLAAGVVAGAAAGLPLALFTFGLSVPIGVAVGGSAGAAVGATVGGTAGAVGGCAVGYGYEHRSEIRTGIDGAKTKVAAYGEYVKTTALVSKDRLTATLRRSSAGA
eukprot:TRINITY_DN1083_c0_g2_i1.p1 TRINITY_DN1083_c0_g2~~TRINITY_DN1083_c0_g2_i1.p1  ORF type:complete len:702 (+),score=150.59 TRINITY_DN1083_c0_g2_i1:60-2108(+)